MKPHVPGTLKIHLATCELASASEGHIQLCQENDIASVDIILHGHNPEVMRQLKPLVGKRRKWSLVSEEAA